MNFLKLIKDIKNVKYDKKLENLDVKDIKIDSRKVENGDIFIALKGKDVDGNNFVSDALKRGASVIVSENDLPYENAVKVEDARNFYALACKNFFDRACEDLKVVAVTGTNGKTTTTQAICEVLRFSGKKAGVIGTLGANFSGHNGNIDTGFTTPDPYILHNLFLQMKNNGCEYVVMEASAHAIALKKLDGIDFEVGVLTNITEDHLDYFKNMEDYAFTKLKLFEDYKVKSALFCGDDKLCLSFAPLCNCPVLTYGLNPFCDINAKDIKKSFEGSSFICDYAGELINIDSSLVGEYNIQNALACIGVCLKLGLSKEIIMQGVNSLNQTEGRFNIVKYKNLNLVIDYAHTPDGLEKVLSTARDLTDNKVVAIFGCGGNRDKLKRPIMGRIAEAYADDVILTSDNPRYEEPMSIIGDIKKGMSSKAIIIENRKEAIEYALSKYKNGETIIIAGKGAEKYQEIKGEKIPYNDFDVIYDFIKSQIIKENLTD